MGFLIKVEAREGRAIKSRLMQSKGLCFKNTTLNKETYHRIGKSFNVLHTYKDSQCISFNIYFVQPLKMN